MNVERVRFCSRLDPWVATWATAPSDDVCAECGVRVVYNPTVGEGEVTLICLECLTRDAPPSAPEDLTQPHSFQHPEHCSACMAVRSYRRDSKGWNGSW